MAVKPTTSTLQTGHALYTNLNNCWDFRGNGTDLRGNNSFTLIDVGSDTITYPDLGGDEGQVVDRDADAGTDRLSLSSAVTSGTTFSIAGRVYVRSLPASFGVILTAGGTAAVYALASGAGFQFTYYSGASSGTVLNFNQWYNFVFANSPAGWDWFVDGTLHATSGTGFGSTALDSSLSNGSSERLDGRINMLSTWLTRKLLLADAQTLNTDPYVLIRAASSGGGGSGKGGGAGGNKGGGGPRTLTEPGGAASYLFRGL